MALLRQAQLDPANRKRLKPEVFGVPEVPSVRAQQPEPAAPLAPAGLGAPEEFGAGTTIREGQTPEGFTRQVEGPRGAFGEITTEQPTTTQTPEEVEAGFAGIEERQAQRFATAEQLAGQEQAAPTTASQIQELESQLATPGRGLRQSFGDLLTEQQGRRTARERLDKLYAQQKTETTQAGQTQRAKATAATSVRTQQNADRNYELAVARFRQTGSQADQASKRRAFEDARNVHTTFAKDKYEDDPDKQQAYVAKQLAAKDPNFLGSPEGQGYTRQVKGDVVNAIRGERGLFDAIFGDEAPTQSDIESFSFKGWKIGDAGPWFGDPTVAKKGQSGNYAYLDNLSDEQVWVLQQLIRQDNPEDYPNAKREGIRTGQR